MGELKKVTIKTWYSEETYICYDIDVFLSEICFCDAYEVIHEESAADLQPLYDEYFNRIPKDQFYFKDSETYWKNSILQLLSGYYETFEEMYNESCF